MKQIKKDFPIFSHQKNLVYLDSAATYQKPGQVIDAVSDFYKKSYASVHRALYPLGEQATQKFEDVREKTQKFINASSCEEIIFTSGATQSINIVATGWAQKNVKPGDQILVTQVEHHANLLPWQRVAKQTGAELKFIELDHDSYMLKNPADYVTEKTKLVAVTHSSNILGHVWPDGALEKLIARAHDVGAKVLLDCAQSVIHEKIDVKKLVCDFCVFSSHKMMGPSGVGVLYIKKELLEDVEPMQLGGSMVHRVTFENSTWDKAPGKFEAGTPALEAVVGFGAALDYIQENINFSALQKHETKLCSQLIDGLAKFEKIKIVGNVEQIKKQGHVVCFSVDGIHAHDVASFLGSKGVAVRAGHHCAQPLVELLGFDSLLRVSVGAYSSVEDIDALLNTLKQALLFF